MSIQDHILLRYLDEPLKFLIFDVDDMIVGMTGFYLLVNSGGSVLVFLGALASLLVWKRFKKAFRGSSLQAIIYWTIPYFNSRTKAFPPSYIREFV